MAVAQQKCCVFIDDSNIFIEGKKFYARYLKFRTTTVVEDNRFRIDMGRMVDALLQGREKIYAKLYGSEPPPNDSLWQEIRSQGILVETFQRNSKNYEKELDTSLTADVTEQSCALSFGHQEPTGSVTFIIIGGDLDYRPASKMVLKYKWKLEIVSWDTCLSRDLRNFVRDNKDKDASLTLLDNLATDNPDIYFLDDKWTEQERIPRERTIVFEYKKPVDDKEAKQLNSEVTDLIKFPCRYAHRPDKDPNIVLIIVMIEQEKGGYDTCKLYEEIKAKFSHSHKFERIIDYVTFLQDRRPQNDDLFDCLNPYVNEENENESEHSQTYEAEGGAETEGGGTRGATTEGEGTEGGATEGGATEGGATERGATEGGATERGATEGATERGADESGNVWTSVIRSKQKKSKQKFSEQCKHRFACRYGLDCHKAHTETEKQHFKKHPDMLGLPYKSQFCPHAGKQKCKHQRTPKQCCFAHNLAEARCYNCDPGGLEGVHLMDQCPNKRS